MGLFSTQVLEAIQHTAAQALALGPLELVRSVELQVAATPTHAA